MDKNDFLLVKQQNEIDATFLNKGWLTISRGNYKHIDTHFDETIFCCLIDDNKLQDYISNTDWGMSPGSEGKPSVYGDNTYKTYSEEGIEPFIFKKHFYYAGGGESYVDISEEFILYFKLYEKLISGKQERVYYFIDDVGELDEVIKVYNADVHIKYRYLLEYISIRKLNLAICFDFMSVMSKPIIELEVESKDETIKGEHYIYSQLIRPLDSSQTQHWIRGKIIKKNNPDCAGYHFSYEEPEDLTFITGYDDNGREVLESCSKTVNNALTFTYFSKEVLDKYYNDPKKYKVDGWSVRSDFFSLKIDNNIQDYVPVFLTNLSYLPYKEQLHWKQYNIPPQDKIMSLSYYETMIKGNWASSPETVDLYFKLKLNQFNELWEQKYGWQLYKPLAKENEHYLEGLHLPVTNNIKSFCNQILALVIITIDSLNQKEFKIKASPNDKSIRKFELFIESEGLQIPKMFEFLRHLQNLRSGLIAHRFSQSNKSLADALEYFKLKDDNYVEVAKEIFIKSVYTLNTLEKRLLKDNTDL